jgi:hypothetical protein
MKRRAWKRLRGRGPRAASGGDEGGRKEADMTNHARGTQVTTISLPNLLMRKVDGYVKKHLSIRGVTLISRNSLIRKAVAEFFWRREHIGAREEIHG